MDLLNKSISSPIKNANNDIDYEEYLEHSYWVKENISVDKVYV